MVKLAALLAALPITALCIAISLYAAKLSVLILTHWQAQIGIAVLLYLLPMAVLSVRKRRQAREKPRDEPPSRGFES